MTHGYFQSNTLAFPGCGRKLKFVKGTTSNESYTLPANDLVFIEYRMVVAASVSGAQIRLWSEPLETAAMGKRSAAMKQRSNESSVTSTSELFRSPARMWAEPELMRGWLIHHARGFPFDLQQRTAVMGNRACDESVEEHGISKQRYFMIHSGF